MPRCGRTSRRRTAFCGDATGWLRSRCSAEAAARQADGGKTCQSVAAALLCSTDIPALAFATVDAP
jgi:hypothetical protein